MNFIVNVDKHELDHLVHVSIIVEGGDSYVFSMSPEQYEYFKERLW